MSSMCYGRHRICSLGLEKMRNSLNTTAYNYLELRLFFLSQFIFECVFWPLDSEIKTPEKFSVSSNSLPIPIKIFCGNPCNECRLIQ